MAQLNSSNVANGNIVESNDILQLYDAFTAGGGTTGVYNVSISGSLTGSATSSSYALSASYASTTLSASYASTALSASYASTALSASYASTALSASYSVSSSRTVTSSYALTAGSALSSSYSQNTDVINSLFSASGSGFGVQAFATACGSVFGTGSLAPITASFLVGRTLGTDAFIMVTGLGSGISTSLRSFNPVLGSMQFQINGGSGNELIMYTILYKPG